MKKQTEKTTARKAADSQESEKENGGPSLDGKEEDVSKAAPVPVPKPAVVAAASKSSASGKGDEKKGDADATAKDEEAVASVNDAADADDAADAADADDEYEWSDWDAEEVEEKFVRPKQIVPVIAKKEISAAAKSAAIQQSGTTPGAKGGHRWAVAAACAMAVLALAGVLYSVTAMRSMAERMASFEATEAEAEVAAEAEGTGEAKARGAAVPATEGEATRLSEGEDEGSDGSKKLISAASPVEVPDRHPAADGTSAVAEAEVPESMKGITERLEYLERRAKLTKLADEAISSGSRYAFNQLEAEFDKPGLVGMKVAANSEIIRVESIYATTSTMSFREIPTDMIDPTLKSDTELSIAQLGDILLSSAVPPEARARAAELLPRYRTFDACALLVECVRTEPNLAVLVKATRSFKEMTGYPGARVFAGPGLEEWFEANRTEIKMALGAASAVR